MMPGMILIWRLMIPLLGLLILPPDWERIPAVPRSFGEYIQQLSFKRTDSTYFWNGTSGIYHNVAAVHMLDRMSQNQQCADIIMRLYSEYMISKNKKIIWHSVNGQEKTWDGHDLYRYLNDIYNYSNTFSLYKYDSYAIPLNRMQPGDILVIPGFPGHAVIIADVIKKDNRFSVAVIEGFTPAVHPFLYKSGKSVYIPWVNGILVSGYHFTDNNIRRLK